MKLWPASYPKKCTYDDVRFFMLLCHGHEPKHAADIEVHVGSSPFGFCKSLLGSGIFARSILAPLSLDKQVAHAAFDDETKDLIVKNLKRHFLLKTAAPSTWQEALILACQSTRFLKAFDAANTGFSAGWLKEKLSSLKDLQPTAINARIEFLSANTVKGTAYDAKDSDRVLSLDFYINDTFIGISQTDGMRRDIQELAGSNTKCEFTHIIRLPRHLTARNDLYLSIYDHESGALLCPAIEYPIVDIRHTSPIQQINKQIEKLAGLESTDDNRVDEALSRIDENLPTLKQYAAFPIEHYSLYKQLYSTPMPPLAEGLLPNICIAKGPEYTYDAKADVIIFLPQGDKLLDGAVEWVQHAALVEPDAHLFFTDYEQENGDGQTTPIYRTPFDLDTFLENPTSACAYAVKRQRLEEVGGLNMDEPLPHAGLWLRLLGRNNTKGIVHVPHVAFLLAPLEPRQLKPVSLLNEFFDYTDSAAKADPHRDKYGGDLISAVNIKWPIDEDLPKLAIIIPTRNAHELIKGCVDSLRRTLEHPSATEIIIVDNGSTDKDTKDWLHAVDAMDGIRVLLHDAPFNWAEINNKAVAESDADYFLFLNNDTLALDIGWDHILRGYLAREEVGMVGARLLFEDGTIQFGGYIVNPDNIALKEAYSESPDIGGYMNRSKLTHTSTALIGAFMACRRSEYE